MPPVRILHWSSTDPIKPGDCISGYFVSAGALVGIFDKHWALRERPLKSRLYVF